MECVSNQTVDIDSWDEMITPEEIADTMTSEHKSILLKYLQLSKGIVTDPGNYPKIIRQICVEFKKEGLQISETDCVHLIKFWVEFVKQRYLELKKSRNDCIFSIDEWNLLALIDEDTTGEPTNNELACILDHLEIAHNTPRIWLNIADELEALGAPNHDSDYWKETFERLCNKVRRKEHIINGLDLDSNEEASYFSTLERRLLEFLKSKRITFVKSVNNFMCRVCLQTKCNEFRDIYDYSSDNKTIADKMCECANIQVDKNDELPRYICESCFNRLEEAYKFKILCETSDQDLRNINKENSNNECVEYIIGDINDFPVDNIENFEEDMLDDNPIESNISYEEEKFKDKEEKYMDDVKCDVDEENTLKEAEMKIHQCDTCGIICYNKASLRKHMHSHSIQRPHKCNICRKQFKTKLTLRIHMRSHTGERPYICEVCGKTFTQVGTLQYHRSIHTGEKKHICGICAYRARNINDLKIHNRKHTGIRPYHCSQCPAKFTTSSNLHKHLRRHTGLKDYECGSCGRSFFSKESARKHMVIHTGLKPYVCTECPMAYGWYNGLQKHMKMQHPGIKMPTEKYFLNLLAQ